MASNQYMMCVEDVAKELDCSKSYAYKIVKMMNIVPYFGNRARKKCESLFEIIEQMQELYECEVAFVAGDDLFQEEHQAWLHYEGQLKAQGYSYEEVVALKEHYRSEIAKLRVAEKEQEKEQIREKKYNNTQPIL